MHRLAFKAGLITVLCVLAANSAQAQYYGEPRDDGEFGAALLVVGAVAATAPFWAPMLVTGSDNSEPGFFDEYPYKHDRVGNMRLGMQNGEVYDWNLQAKTAYAENFSGSSRIDTSVQLEGAHRFGIDTEFNYWRNSMIPGGTHSFWTGDANLMYRFSQNEWLQTRAGLGGTWIKDGADSDYGFNFTYKADLFIGNPFILSGELDWGTLGDESLFHPRITLGAQWHRAELFIGADYYDIGPTQSTSMIVGGRFWY